MCKEKNKSNLFLDLIAFSACTAITTLIVSFATPYWYKADPDVVSAFLPGKTPDVGVWIDSVGLWMYCYRRGDFSLPRYFEYSVACRSYYSAFPVTVSLPGFFVAVQVFYTIGLGLACIIILFLLATICCCGKNRKCVAISGAILTVAAILISIALIIFAASTSDLRGGTRVGIFGSTNQDSFWSFWLAVAGVCLLWISTLACFMEVWLIQKREEIDDIPDEIYTVNTVYIPSEGGYVPFTSV